MPDISLYANGYYSSGVDSQLQERESPSKLKQRMPAMNTMQAPNSSEIRTTGPTDSIFAFRDAPPSMTRNTKLCKNHKYSTTSVKAAKITVLNEEPAIGNYSKMGAGTYPLTPVGGLALQNQGQEVYYSFHDPKFHAFANRYDNSNKDTKNREGQDLKVQGRLGEISIDNNTLMTP